MRNPRYPVALTLDKALFESLEGAAVARGISVSAYIRMTLARDLGFEPDSVMGYGYRATRLQKTVPAPTPAQTEINAPTPFKEVEPVTRVSDPAPVAAIRLRPDGPVHTPKAEREESKDVVFSPELQRMMTNEYWQMDGDADE